MTDKELIEALREDAEWAQANEWETPITLSDNLRDAADRLEALIAENELLYREVAQLKAECDHFREVTKKLWCEKRYVGEDMNVPAIADHIRAMSDFELMEFLRQFNCDSFENALPFCKNTTECGEELDSGDITEDMCKQCLLQKLLQPYESPTGQKG